MNFQICRLIGQQGIRAGVSFGKTVEREFFHQVKQLLRLLGRNAARGATGKKFVALRSHHFDLFLAHRASQDVRFAERKSGDAVRDLHHLFLKNDDAPRFRQNFFQFREVVGNFFLAMFARDEFVDHAALNRTRTIQSVQRRKIFHPRGLIAFKNVAHAMRFKLKYPAGISAREESVGLRIVKRKKRQIEVHAPIFLDHFDRVIEHGQRSQTQKIHFQ